MKERIHRISEETRAALLRKSAYGLSVRPKETGKTAEELKKVFYAPFLDREESLLAEINRLADEWNRVLSEKEGTAEKTAIVNDSVGGKATAPYAASLGEGTVADGTAQLAAGRFNRSENALLVIGCGTDDAHRENACWITEEDGEVRLYLKNGAYLNEEMLLCLADLSEGRLNLERCVLYADEIGAKRLNLAEALQSGRIETELLEAKTAHIEKLTLDGAVRVEDELFAEAVQTDRICTRKISVAEEPEWNGVPLSRRICRNRVRLTGTESGFLSHTHYYGEVRRMDLSRLCKKDSTTDLDEAWTFTFRLLSDEEASDGGVAVILPRRVSWVGDVPSFCVGGVYEITFSMGISPQWNEETGAYEGDIVGRWACIGGDVEKKTQKRRKK